MAFWKKSKNTTEEELSSENPTIQNPNPVVEIPVNKHLLSETLSSNDKVLVDSSGNLVKKFKIDENDILNDSDANYDEDLEFTTEEFEVFLNRLKSQNPTEYELIMSNLRGGDLNDPNQDQRTIVTYQMASPVVQTVSKGRPTGMVSPGPEENTTLSEQLGMQNIPLIKRRYRINNTKRGESTLLSPPASPFPQQQIQKDVQTSSQFIIDTEGESNDIQIDSSNNGQIDEELLQQIKNGNTSFVTTTTTTTTANGSETAGDNEVIVKKRIPIITKDGKQVYAEVVEKTITTVETEGEGEGETVQEVVEEEEGPTTVYKTKTIKKKITHPSEVTTRNVEASEPKVEVFTEYVEVPSDDPTKEPLVKKITRTITTTINPATGEEEVTEEVTEEIEETIEETNDEAGDYDDVEVREEVVEVPSDDPNQSTIIKTITKTYVTRINPETGEEEIVEEDALQGDEDVEVIEKVIEVPSEQKSVQRKITKKVIRYVTIINPETGKEEVVEQVVEEPVEDITSSIREADIPQENVEVKREVIPSEDNPEQSTIVETITKSYVTRINPETGEEEIVEGEIEEGDDVEVIEEVIEEEVEQEPIVHKKLIKKVIRYITRINPETGKEEVVEEVVDVPVEEEKEEPVATETRDVQVPEEHVEVKEEVVEVPVEGSSQKKIIKKIIRYITRINPETGKEEVVEEVVEKPAEDITSTIREADIPQENVEVKREVIPSEDNPEQSTIVETVTKSYVTRINPETGEEELIEEGNLEVGDDVEIVEEVIEEIIDESVHSKKLIKKVIRHVTRVNPETGKEEVVEEVVDVPVEEEEEEKEEEPVVTETRDAPVSEEPVEVKEVPEEENVEVIEEIIEEKEVDHPDEEELYEEIIEEIVEEHSFVEEPDTEVKEEIV